MVEPLRLLLVGVIVAAARADDGTSTPEVSVRPTAEHRSRPEGGLVETGDQPSDRRGAAPDRAGEVREAAESPGGEANEGQAGAVAKGQPGRRENYRELPQQVRQKFHEYARATVRYVFSPQANDLEAGFTHSWFGTGAWREFTGPGQFQEMPDLPRGHGSHVVVNEITLGFNVLAVAYKEGWLDFLPADQRYTRSWGQGLKGLRSLEALQSSGDRDKYVEGTFHRAYLTVIPGEDDCDRTVAELIQFNAGDRRLPGEQSCDDNALTYMNLLVLQGLVQDPAVDIPDRDRQDFVRLIGDILSRINLRRFVINDRIAFNFRNESGSRSSGEGSPGSDGGKPSCSRPSTTTWSGTRPMWSRPPARVSSWRGAVPTSTSRCSG